MTDERPDGPASHHRPLTGSRPFAEPRSATIGRLMGREAERARLDQLLDSAIGGQGRLLLVAGDAGIGKTHLAEACADRARAQGVRVLWGRCFEGPGSPAFWPWVQLLRSYIAGADAAFVRSALAGADAAVLAQMLPQLGQLVPNLGEPPALGHDEARFRFFDCVARFLTAASRQPLLLVLDDLHWADQSSQLLLQFFARELREASILAIATYRDTEVDTHLPLARVLAALAREPACERLTLHGLTEAELAPLIEAITGTAPSTQLVTRIAQRTDGNPFFVTEIARLLAAERERPRSAATAEFAALPPTVHAVVGRRLERLSAACIRALSVASLIGRDFDLGTLARLSELDGQPLLELLEEAELAHVIGAVAGAPGSYRFAHAIVAEVLAAEVASSRRMRLHAQIGVAIEARAGRDLVPHLAPLAEHFFHAAASGPSERRRAALYARRAGEQALTLLAFEDAARHFEMGITALDLRFPGDDAGSSEDVRERCELLLALARAHLAAGETVQSRRAIERAAEIARRLGDGVLLARAALGFVVEVENLEADDGAVAVHEQALAALGDADQELRVRVLISLVRTARDRRRRLDLSDQSLSTARALDDPVLLAAALEARRLALWQPDNADERLALSSEAVRVAAAAGIQDLAVQALWWRIVDLLELGDTIALTAAVEDHARGAEASRQPVHRWISLLARTALALLNGRLDEAESLTQRALAVGRRLQRRGVRSAYAIHIFLIRYLQGRLAEIEEDLHRVADVAPVSLSSRITLMLVHAETDRMDEARIAFEQLAREGFESLPRDYMWISNICFLAEIASALDDAPRAADLYALLLPHAERNAVMGVGGGPLGAAARFLGLAAAAAGRWPEAEGHFAAALALNERMGARPWLARTRFDFARVLLRGDRDDCRRAVTLLAETIDEADALGLTELSNRCRLLIGGARAPAPEAAGARAQRTGSARLPFPDGLSPREVDVLRLLAAGHTNREIAERLVLSPLTVARHIANIYIKIGARGRAEATTYALRQNLIQFRVE